jgi:hypothetical protein
MLTQLTVKNLGCFDDTDYKLSLTQESLIVGPNNSGKSMIITGLNLARYILRIGLTWDTEFYSLHDFEASVNCHKLDKKILISYKLKEKEGEYDISCSITRMGPQLSVTLDGKRYGMDAHLNDLIEKIWYLRPNRSAIPYFTPTVLTKGPLQPLRPDGSNVINYLLERWTGRDEKWDLAESWLRKIDPDMSILKTPISGSLVSLETRYGKTDVNVSLQGSGFQSAAAIVTAVVFSPEDSTIIIEEPEAFLHPQSQEVILDLLNDAVNNHGKQIIFSTHSFNVMLPIWHDVGQPRQRRGDDHVCTDPTKFSMHVFQKTGGKPSITPYAICEKTWKNFSEDFKHLWG